jgi:hypothetical protein
MGRKRAMQARSVSLSPRRLTLLITVSSAPAAQNSVTITTKDGVSTACKSSKM